jgi:hypothetical protein
MSSDHQKNVFHRVSFPRAFLKTHHGVVLLILSADPASVVGPFGCRSEGGFERPQTYDFRTAVPFQEGTGKGKILKTNEIYRSCSASSKRNEIRFA